MKAEESAAAADCMRAVCSSETWRLIGAAMLHLVVSFVVITGKNARDTLSASNRFLAHL